MRRIAVTLIALLLTIASAGCCRSQPDFIKVQPQAKKHHLVLLHGLTNKHHWSEPFLDVLLTVWGSSKVFAVYTNDPDHIWQRSVAGRRLICAGKNDFSAGDGSIDKQAAILVRAVQRLQKEQGLGQRFYILAHSMGGLVARRFIYLKPGVVAGLVTLGTPHQGSPLADSFAWAGFFLGATEAIKDLQPDRARLFNQKYPVLGAPLAPGGRVFTVRGNCPEGRCWGWDGELALGWSVLKSFYHTDNDGLVPWGSAVINGAKHIADYPNHDHYDLVIQPEVALKAAGALP